MSVSSKIDPIISASSDKDFLNFLYAASSGNIEFLHNFIARRHNEINKIDDTYLAAATHFAAKFHQLAALQFLVRNGAILGRMTNENLNEIHYGITDLSVIQFVLEQNPQLINSVGQKGITPLAYAIECNAPEVAEFLLDHPEVNVTDNDFESTFGKQGFENAHDKIATKIISQTKAEEFTRAAINPRTVFSPTTLRYPAQKVGHLL